MHEAGLMQSVLEIACEQMQREGANAIQVIRLRVGVLSGAACEALQFAFDAMKNGTPAALARLEIEPVPLRLVCQQCGDHFQAEGFHDPCPQCDGWKTNVIAGRELDLVSLDLAINGD